MKSRAMNTRPGALVYWMVVFVLLCACLCSAGERSATLPFPDWVLGHVVWEDESTTQGTYDLVEGYLDRGIPVDAVIIDSPWETEYNTFEFDPSRYPEAEKLIADLHSRGIKVVLWITSMVNLEDPEYGYCLEQGYFVSGMEEVKWWKGTGGMIDYDNPAALDWWHKRMDKAIDLGLDGWKCDGTDPFMLFKGWNARKRYSAAYYSDFYNYTRERSGRDTVIMARPMEQILNEGLLGIPTRLNPLGIGLYLKYAPREVSFMSWVGDQDPTFDGLKIALRWILDSADNGYLVLGSDIGGYRDGGPSKEVFIRWTQLGTFCPLMENGGIGEHRPWMFDEQTLEIYKRYVLMHKALGPYLSEQSIGAWQDARSLITPLGRDRYLLGKDILVAPITSPGGKRRVVLPEGSNWRALSSSPGFIESAGRCVKEDSDSPVLEGGCSFVHTYALEEYPVFIRDGADVPIP